MLGSYVMSIAKSILSSHIPENLRVFLRAHNFVTDHDKSKPRYMSLVQLFTLQNRALIMFGWFSTVSAIYRCRQNSAVSALLGCATSIQANPLRFAQSVLSKSVGRLKVGAQICNFQALTMLGSKVTPFRTHAQILLNS
jgi:hypothetical protein